MCGLLEAPLRNHKGHNHGRSPICLVRNALVSARFLFFACRFSRYLSSRQRKSRRRESPRRPPRKGLRSRICAIRPHERH